MKNKELLLTETEIGDCLDLDDEAEYERSDGSYVATVSVNKLIKAQLSKVLKAGYVKLAEAQSLPENPYGEGLYSSIGRYAVEKYKKLLGDWRKVILKINA